MHSKLRYCGLQLALGWYKRWSLHVLRCDFYTFLCLAHTWLPTAMYISGYETIDLRTITLYSYKLKISHEFIDKCFMCAHRQPLVASNKGWVSRKKKQGTLTLGFSNSTMHIVQVAQSKVYPQYANLAIVDYFYGSNIVITKAHACSLSCYITLYTITCDDAIKRHISYWEKSREFLQQHSITLVYFEKLRWHGVWEHYPPKVLL